MEQSEIQQAAKKYTIFGNPVKHSKSPNMQNAGLKEIGVDGLYDKTHLTDGEQIKQTFLDKELTGANITVPHKEIAFRQADEVRGLAQKIGAVNTYINEDGKVIAYNTDAPGFLMAMEEYGEIKKALIFGAGGTAKAIAVGLKEKGIDVSILNRSEGRLGFFKELDCSTFTWEDFKIDKFDILINTTTAGLNDTNYPAPLEIVEALIKDTSAAMDCVYGKQTPFLELASKYSVANKDGEDMLLYQGVLALEYFTNKKSDKKVISAMRNGLKS